MLLSGPINFFVSIAESAHGLQLSYQVENKSDSYIYLQNHGVRIVPGQGPVPDRNALWIYLLEDKKIVHLSKRRPAVSEKLIQPRPHFVTPLKPGESFDEKIIMPLPLKQNDPNCLTLQQAGREVQRVFHHACFSLEYLIGNETVRAIAGMYQGEDVYSISPLFDDDAQPLPMTEMQAHILSSEVYDIEIPVILVG